jgi:hypothetical protein
MKSLKISPLFSVMTLLLALFIVVMVNLTIIISEDVDFLKRFLPLANLLCTAPHFVNTVRQHFVEYLSGNIQPGLNCYCHLIMSSDRRCNLSKS